MPPPRTFSRFAEFASLSSRSARNLSGAPTGRNVKLMRWLLGTKRLQEKKKQQDGEGIHPQQEICVLSAEIFSFPQRCLKVKAKISGAQRGPSGIKMGNISSVHKTNPLGPSVCCRVRPLPLTTVL